MVSNLWLVACVALDVGVITINICEQLIISIKWNTLNRVDHLLFSLSISDLVCGLGSLGADSWYIWNRTNTVSSNQTTSTYSSNNSVLQNVFDLVFLFSLFASALHVMYLAIERVCAIRFPGKYMMFGSFRFQIFTISAIWLISVILTPTLAFALDRSNGTLKLVYGYILAIIMSLVFTTNFSVVYFLHKSVAENENPDARGQYERMKCLAIMCLFLGISFFACMFPITLSYFHDDHYHELSNLMVTLNSFINPCIYFAKVYCDKKISRRAFPNMDNELISMGIDDENGLTTSVLVP